MRDRTWVRQQSTAMASFTLLFPLTLPPVLPLSLLGAQTRLLSSRLAALIHSSHSSLLHPSSFLFFPQALRLFPHALRSASEGFFYTCILFDTLETLGASPFLFYPALSAAFSIFSSSASCPRVFSFSLSIPPIPARASCITSLSSSSPSSSRTECHVLSLLTSPVTMCLCVGLSSLFLHLPFSFLLRLGSQPEIQKFSLL